MTVAAVLTVSVAAIFRGVDLSAVEWSGVLALVYGILPGTLLGFLLYSSVVVRFGATKGTQTEYLVPVVAAVTGMLFLGERITLVMVVGMAIVFSGIAVATLRPRVVE